MLCQNRFSSIKDETGVTLSLHIVYLHFLEKTITKNDYQL